MSNVSGHIGLAMCKLRCEQSTECTQIEFNRAKGYCKVFARPKKSYAALARPTWQAYALASMTTVVFSKASSTVPSKSYSPD